jgi:hypothetical protein
VTTAGTPTEVMAAALGPVTVTGDAERTIAGRKRAGKIGTVVAPTGKVTTEAFTFELGPYTVAVALAYDRSSAEQIAADLARITRLDAAD